MNEHLRLFTGRYSNPNIIGSGLMVVGITRYPPRFRLAYELKANLYDLAPSAALLAKAKDGLRQEDFLAEYERQLARLGLEDILKQIVGLQGGARGVVLCCYEDVTSGQVCHRTMLADWMKRIGGIVVLELPDPGKKTKREKATPDHQGRLW